MNKYDWRYLLRQLSRVLTGWCRWDSTVYRASGTTAATALPEPIPCSGVLRSPAEGAFLPRPANRPLQISRTHIIII